MFARLRTIQETVPEADNTFMAQNRLSPSKNTESSPDEPLLRQGRPADPERQSPDSENPPVTETDDDDSGQDAVEAEQDSPPDDSDQTTDFEKTIAEARQRKLRLMLRQCDRVMLMDFEILAMPDWPDSYTVAAARRSRDLWLLCSLMAAIVFLSGLTGFVPAWIAGGGFGAFVILVLSGVPSVRGLVTGKPSHLDLIMKRRRMIKDAQKHIQHLEGNEGLVWQCAHMAEFNHTLRGTRFSELRALSERRALTKHLNRREHIRLYLIYLLEAEKAYRRMEKAFFDGHQQALDKGWESVAASSEGSA